MLVPFNGISLFSRILRAQGKTECECRLNHYWYYEMVITGAINVNAIYQESSDSYKQKWIGPNEVGPCILFSLNNLMFNNLCAMGFSMNRLDGWVERIRLCEEYWRLRWFIWILYWFGLGETSTNLAMDSWQQLLGEISFTDPSTFKRARTSRIHGRETPKAWAKMSGPLISFFNKIGLWSPFDLLFFAKVR